MRNSDGRVAGLGAAAVEIGELVRWRGRRWLVRGFTPVSLPERLVELEQIESGEWARAPMEEIEPDSDQGGGSVHALRPRPE